MLGDQGELASNGLIIFLLILILIAVSRRPEAGTRSYARFVATYLLILVLAPLTGYFLDSLAGTLPLFFLLGLIGGLVGMMFYAYREYRNLTR